MLAGINNPKMAEVQALNGLVHRLGRFRGLAEFAFDPIPAASMYEERSISAPLWVAQKNCLRRLYNLQGLFEAKPSTKPLAGDNRAESENPECSAKRAGDPNPADRSWAL